MIPSSPPIAIQWEVDQSPRVPRSGLSVRSVLPTSISASDIRSDLRGPKRSTVAPMNSMPSVIPAVRNPTICPALMSSSPM